MKTIRNRSRQPLRVRLSRGKVLHLNPGREGQIAAHDVEFEGVRRLVEAGELEIVGEGSQTATGSGRKGGVHPDTHGHHPEISVPKRGDR